MSGRTRLISCDERSGHVRLVRSVTDNLRSGSHHREVPVKPKWPKARGPKSVPDCDGWDGVSQPSARDVEGRFSRRVKSATVSGETIGEPPSRMQCANVATSSADPKTPA